MPRSRPVARALAATTILSLTAVLATSPAVARMDRPPLVDPALAGRGQQDIRVPLGGHGDPAPPGAHRLGAVAPDRAIDVAGALRPHDEPGLNAFVKAVSDPASPQYRQYLSSAAYAERFAPRQSEVDATANFLRAN